MKNKLKMFTVLMFIVALMTGCTQHSEDSYTSVPEEGDTVSGEKEGSEKAMEKNEAEFDNLPDMYVIVNEVVENTLIERDMSEEISTTIYHHVYNEAGQLIMKWNWVASYKIRLIVYTYDEQGNLIEESMYYHGSISDPLPEDLKIGDVELLPEDMETRFVYSYDESGNCMESVYYERDYRDSDQEGMYERRKIEFIYDDAGLLVTELDDLGEYEIKYSYDANQHLIEKAYFTDIHDVNVMQKEKDILYTYDEKGNLVKEEEKEYEWSIDRADEYEVTSCDVTEYQYDEAGNLLKESNNSAYNSSIYYEYTYDSENRRIQEIKYLYTEDGTCTRKTETVYEWMSLKDYFKENRI